MQHNCDTNKNMDIEDSIQEPKNDDKETIRFTKELLRKVGNPLLKLNEKDIENEIKNIRRKLRIKQPSKIEMRECYEKYFSDEKIYIDINYLQIKLLSMH